MLYPIKVRLPLSFLLALSCLILGGYMYAHETWKHRHTHTQQRPVNHTFIAYCWDAHSSAEERERGPGNRWRLKEQVNEKKKSKKWEGKKCKNALRKDLSRNLRLTFPVCVRHESAQCSRRIGLVVCLRHSPVYSFLTWWLGLLIPHLLQQLFPTQYLWMGTVLREGNGSQRWEMMLFIEPWKYHCFLHSASL